MTSRGSMIGLLLAFAAGAFVFWVLGIRAEDDARQPAADSQVGSPAAFEPPAPAASAPVQSPAAENREPPKKLRLPDGSEVEPLNGVKQPAVMTWGDGPYSPITGTEFGNGIDWYVHADGTRTTTIEVWRAELGRLDPVTLVYRPVPGGPATLDAGSAGPTSREGK